MKSRPLIFSLLAFSFLLIALSFPVQAFFIYGESLPSTLYSFKMVSTLNYALALALLLNIPLLLRASSYLTLSIPLTTSLLFWNNFVTGYMNMGVSMETSLLASISFGIFTITLLSPKALQVLKDPTRRWWLQRQRATVTMPVEVKGCRINFENLQTYDLSTTGAFLVGFDEFDFEQTSEIGRVFDLSIAVSPLLKVKCEARMVRAVTDEDSRYPRGIGVQFLGISRKDQNKIDQYVKTDQPQYGRDSIAV
ncbi:PilZ domain-containing protein [Bdellovibrionales bacterium]|nr:PilZ domain-containing protein [Bdellovibrionales bacterium]